MILAEAERLYGLGFGVHWIKKNSKAPVKTGWSNPVRDNLKTVKADYKPGYGLGVRLGEPSKLKDGTYLANIDVDIKSTKHQKLALKRLEKMFPNLFDTTPVVKTGYGYRLVVKTRQPMQSVKLFTSKELCKVSMPGTEINRRQLDAVKQGLITQAELQDGMRIRAAYEIEFMSIGKQALLPPSIHPETGRKYVWQRPVMDCTGIVLLEAGEVGSSSGISEGAGPDDLADSDLTLGRKNTETSTTDQKKFQPVPYDLNSRGLAEEHRLAITEGSNVVDRSAAMFSACMALVRHGYSDNEILSILTDKKNFLGEVAFEHRKTKSRINAANWVQKYCLRKAKSEASAAASFAISAGAVPLLQSKDEINQQTIELTEKHANISSQLEYNKNGKALPNFGNTLLILQRDAGEIILRDEFTTRDHYNKSPPWGWEAGRIAGDNDDLIKIKSYLQGKYGLAPSRDTIWEAVTQIALINAYHPIRQELNALPEWDGKNRLDNWLTKHFGAKDPDGYVGDVFRKWMVASVTRIFKPGAKFDWMMVLEGTQGIGKSQFGDILAGEQYFADTLPDLRSKDSALALEGKRIVEFGELSHLRTSDDEIIKGFIVRRIDSVRRPYDKKQVDIPRQCIFLGTTDKTTYLKDTAGNRRYLPVRVGNLNVKQLHRDRDQLWAEAFFIYENMMEPSLYLSGKSLAYAKQSQSEKMVVSDSSLMTDKLYDFFKNTGPDNQAGIDPEKFKILDLFDLDLAPLSRWNQNAHNVRAAAEALKNIGAVKRKIMGLHFWQINSRIISEYERKMEPVIHEN